MVALFVRLFIYSIVNDKLHQQITVHPLLCWRWCLLWVCKLAMLMCKHFCCYDKMNKMNESICIIIHIFKWIMFVSRRSTIKHLFYFFFLSYVRLIRHKQSTEIAKSYGKRYPATSVCQTFCCNNNRMWKKRRTRRREARRKKNRTKTLLCQSMKTKLNRQTHNRRWFIVFCNKIVSI